MGKRQTKINHKPSEINIPDTNGVDETSDVEIEPEIISPSKETLKLLPEENIEPAKQIRPLAEVALQLFHKENVEPAKQRLPEELLKSLPEYNNWLRLLSSKMISLYSILSLCG